jgi:uroporphyrin-III C-methyltransferase/precorrin-2 dehydrogenase/sirohydrochlorin ferrochelatase/uroporphyrin-III C-methyltransferase
MPNQPITTGRVIIAGAGPGDPELLTVKALRALQQADVVLADRLVSEQVLVQYVRAGAEIIHVGKQCRRGASTPQEYINELMLEHAGKGKLVVRLKGGDVSIFSNVLDELEALKAAGIAYEIIPGVTAALGAAAYAGIPLTARQYSTAVRFLTFYRNEVIDENYWKELAATDDTLVFYMSSETLDGVVSNLVKNGISADKLLAVVEQATTPLQNVQVTNLYDYAQNWNNKTFVSPALVIIGRVVGLHEQFAWIANSNSSESYFKPVAKLFTASTVVATENANQHVSRA